MIRHTSACAFSAMMDYLRCRFLSRPPHSRVQYRTLQSAEEEDYLAAFDAARGTILDVAREVYSYGRKNIYVLTPADFERGD